MSANEYLGFLRFLVRGKNNIVSWFGSHSNEDARRIVNMAAREWDAMQESEKFFFILSTKPDKDIAKDLTKSLLPVRRSKILKMVQAHETGRSLLTDPDAHRLKRFSSRDVVEIGMDFVLIQRDKLHVRYEAMELNIMEFMLKTKPQNYLTERSWFLKHQDRNTMNKLTTKKWDSLKEPDRRIYQDCTTLDKRRYKVEKHNWLNNLVTLDLSREDLSIEEFKLPPEYMIDIGPMCSEILTSKKTIPVELRKRRPREPFSLFIEHHRYQIRGEKPEFKFAEHLRLCSEAWSKLTTEQKEEFHKQSDELKVARKAEMDREDAIDVPTELTKILRWHRRKKPIVGDFYGKMNSIPKSLRNKTWEALTSDAKETYMKEYRRACELVDAENAMLEDREQYLEKLMKKLPELVSLKKNLDLTN